MNGVIEWIIFLPLALIAIVTAAGMIITMSMYRAGLALMASFVALAGLFILLDADLLAAIQVMMNVGGMLAMVLFMVMMMMDPGGEMMWGMKRDMHMPGPGAFSMHMPSGPPPPEEREQQETQKQESEPQTYTCSMHPEIQQDHPGTCPKCGMTLLEKKNSMQSDAPMMMSVSHESDTLVKQDMPVRSIHDMSMGSQENTEHSQHQHTRHDMDTHDVNMSKMEKGEQGTDGDSKHDMSDMNMGGQDMSYMGGKQDISDMNMGGMTPRQNYDMMVDMAMSTAQLPWAIILGVLSAVLLIALLILTPWSLANTVPTQDASRVVGELLLSRYMIAFEGAALLILAGIAGAVLLAKREHPPVKHVQTTHSEKSDDTVMYTCPMHAEVQQQGPGTCPKCGMTLIPAQETVVANTQRGGQS